MSGLVVAIFSVEGRDAATSLAVRLSSGSPSIPRAEFVVAVGAIGWEEALRAALPAAGEEDEDAPFTVITRWDV